MPALPDVPGVMRLEIDFAVGTDAAALCRFYQAYTGGTPTPGDMAAIAGQLNSAFAGPGAGLMHPDTEVIEIRATDLATTSGYTGTSTDVVTGTRSGAALGADVCALLNFTIGRRYRGGKPRLYLPWGTATDLLTRQTWTTGAVTDWDGGYGDTIGTLTGYSTGAIVLGSQVNVSYYGPPNRIITGSTGRVRTVSTVRVTPIVDEITSLSVNTHLGSQRRRNLIRT